MMIGEVWSIFGSGIKIIIVAICDGIIQAVPMSRNVRAAGKYDMLLEEKTAIQWIALCGLRFSLNMRYLDKDLGTLDEDAMEILKKVMVAADRGEAIPLEIAKICGIDRERWHDWRMRMAEDIELLNNATINAAGVQYAGGWEDIGE